MPLIYSGRKASQVFNQVGNKLVRRSNALEDDYTGSIHPEVRRVISDMHRRMPDAFAKLAWAGGPDGFEISGPNRISKMREIVPGSGDATQGTAADQPELSRDDDRQNLVTHSRLPGTLGATSPDGWSALSGGTGSPDGEIVASDDGSDSHQAWEIPAVTDGRRYIVKIDVPVVWGMRVILAARVEANGYLSGDVNALGFSQIASTLLGERRGLDVVVAGEWAWVARQMDSTGDWQVRAGVGAEANMTTDAATRISRPMIAHLPPQSEGGPDLTDNAAVQQWLDDHYAGTDTDHSELSGYRGMQVPWIREQDLDTTYAPGAVTELSVAVFANVMSVRKVGETTNGLRFAYFDVNANTLSLDGFGRFRFQLLDGSDNPILARISTAETEAFELSPRLWTGTAKVGDNMRVYVDDTEQAVGDSVPSLKAITSSLGFAVASNDRPWWMAWGFIFNKELTATEVTTLNSIIRST